MGKQTLSVEPTRRKHVYREGDTVRIVNSRFIKRVGYPLIWTDLVDEFRSHPKIYEAAALLGVNTGHEFIIGVAKAAVAARGFGGRERTIHYHDTVADCLIWSDRDGRPDCTGRTALVYKKYVRMTGTYFPGGGDAEDWENGGLDNQKTHIILSTQFGEIEAINVEPVQP